MILINLELCPLYCKKAHFNFFCNFLYDVTLNKADISEHIKTVVNSNVEIIGKSEDWAELCFLQNLNIKWKNSHLIVV